MRLRRHRDQEVVIDLTQENDEELKRTVERRLSALEVAVTLIEIRKGLWKPKPQQ